MKTGSKKRLQIKEKDRFMKPIDEKDEGKRITTPVTRTTCKGHPMASEILQLTIRWADVNEHWMDRLVSISGARDSVHTPRARRGRI